MARTTDTLVRGIIELDASFVTTPFISIANELITECCTGVTPAYSAARLVLIETWLAAHFCTNREGRAFEERADVVTERKQSKVDLGFDTSHYGQTAMRLDTLGGLSALNEQSKKGGNTTFGVTWAGSADEDIID